MWQVSNLTQGNIAFFTALISVVGSVSYYIYQKHKKPAIPTKWEPVGTLRELYVYPLKSGKRLPLDRAECTKLGIQVCEEDEKAFQMRDRSFIIYGEDDFEFKTARTYPKMVLIEVFVHDKDHVCFEAPGMRQLIVKIPNNKDKDVAVNLKMRKEKIQALDCGNEAAVWLSRYLIDEERKFRLAYFNTDYERSIWDYPNYVLAYPKLANKPMGMFTDLSSCLLINEASVDDLVNRSKDTNITHNNFRPNIVISGAPAFAEDDWDFIKIGDVIFRNLLPCTRCVLTTVDPVEGKLKKNREPLKTLEKYRVFQNETFKSVFGNKSVMGIFMQIVVPGVIKRSDQIYIGKD